MKVRLIIAEPDEDVLEVHLSYFKRLDDFDPRAADNHQRCIELLKSFSPDVMVLEPAMPQSIAVLELASIPVVVLSRRNMDEALQPNNTIKRYFTKPVPLNLLTDHLRELAFAD